MYCRTDDICNPSLEIVSIKLEKELNIRIYHKIKSTELLYLETKKKSLIRIAKVTLITPIILSQGKTAKDMTRIPGCILYQPAGTLQSQILE
jgi:hypothetical protein